MADVALSTFSCNERNVGSSNESMLKRNHIRQDQAMYNAPGVLIPTVFICMYTSLPKGEDFSFIYDGERHPPRLDERDTHMRACRKRRTHVRGFFHYLKIKCPFFESKQADYMGVATRGHPHKPNSCAGAFFWEEAPLERLYNCGPEDLVLVSDYVGYNERNRSFLCCRRMWTSFAFVRVKARRSI